MSVQLQGLIESPLLGGEGKEWLQEPREKPDEYLEWEDAQIFSLAASKEIKTYKDHLIPLTRTKHKHSLDTIWKFINLVSGRHIVNPNQGPHSSSRITKAFRVKQLMNFGVLVISSTAPLPGTAITFQAQAKM